MTAVQFTVSAVVSPARWNPAAIVLNDIDVAIIDAMRPRVIPLDGHAFDAPALDLEHERVIAASCAVVANNNVGKVLTDFRILQVQHATLVGIADRGTWVKGSYVDQSTVARKVGGWVEFISV